VHAEQLLGRGVELEGRLLTAAPYGYAVYRL
jgi:hypothetical protein